MTTLDVSMSQLDTAIAPYPDVKKLDVSTSFPHTMRIRVIEQIPVATVTVAGRQIEVADDGTLLHADSGAGSLPTIPLSVAPGGPRLTGWALGAVAVLAAAPYQLLPHISQVDERPRPRADRRGAGRAEHLLRLGLAARLEVDGRDGRARRPQLDRSRVHRRVRPGPPRGRGDRGAGHRSGVVGVRKLDHRRAGGWRPIRLDTPSHSDNDARTWRLTLN